jgi:putative membrane protein
VTLLVRLLVTAAALWASTKLVPGIAFTGSNYLALLGVAFVFGAMNLIVRPILKLFSFPIVLLTLGLFLFVLNGVMLLLTSFVSGRLGLGFHVDGLVPAILGSLVVSVISAVVHFVIGTNRDDDDKD